MDTIEVDVRALSSMVNTELVCWDHRGYGYHRRGVVGPLGAWIPWKWDDRALRGMDTTEVVW